MQGRVLKVSEKVCSAFPLILWFPCRDLLGCSFPSSGFYTPLKKIVDVMCSLYKIDQIVKDLQKSATATNLLVKALPDARIRFPMRSSNFFFRLISSFQPRCGPGVD
jgi:hypothetical protein